MRLGPLLLGGLLLLAMAPQGVAPPANANIGNKTPSAVTITPSSATPSPTSGTTTTVTITAVFDDNNGHNDLSGATVTVYKSDNSTVHIAGAAATKDSGSGKRATYSKGVAMNYYDEPGTYYVRAVGTDRAAASVTLYTSFTYGSLSALAMNASSVSLNPGGSGGASVSPGSNTTASPSAITITNTGNTAMDIQYSGTALTNATNGTSIAVGNVRLSRSADMSSEMTLSGTASTDTGFSLARRTGGSDSTKAVYFAVHVPSGTRAGTYTGTITLAAVADS